MDRAGDSSNNAARRVLEPEFENLYATEFERSRRVALLILGSQAEAEEVVQDAFVAVRRRWEQIENPGGYLRSSVVNGARMVLRRRRTEQRLRPSAPPPGIQAPELIELYQALDELDPTQRVAIVLKYFADAHDDAIAEALDCAPSTVRSHIRRGLIILRKELV